MEKFPLWSNHCFFTERSPLMERLCCCAANFFTQLRGQSSGCELSFLFYPSATRVKHCKRVMRRAVECCKDDVLCGPVCKLALLKEIWRVISEVWGEGWCHQHKYLLQLDASGRIIWIVSLVNYSQLQLCSEIDILHILQWLLSINRFIYWHVTILVNSHLHTASQFCPNIVVFVSDKL